MKTLKRVALICLVLVGLGLSFVAGFKARDVYETLPGVAKYLIEKKVDEKKPQHKRSRDGWRGLPSERPVNWPLVGP